MCVPGQDGEKFIDDVYSLLDEKRDHIICKTYYSAFTDTILAHVLKEIDEVHICGLTTNHCIRATTTDAFFHGFKVIIWTDCLGYRREQTHNTVLKIMERWYATLITSKSCLKQSLCFHDDTDI